MKSNSIKIDTITKIMAMTLEQMNAKLADILVKLDSAIEERDLAEVDAAINKAQKLNKTSKGEIYDDILETFNDRISRIANDIKPENGLDASEIMELVQIRSKIKTGLDPFEKTKTVVESLSQKGISQEDLKRYKMSQKEDNNTQIEATKATNQELATGIADIEMRYMGKIENNDSAIEIIKKIKAQKDLLTSLDPSTDGETINATKADIRSKISELEAKGVETTAISTFESNPAVIDTFVTTKTAELNVDSDNIAQNIARDMTISSKIRKSYELRNVTNASELKDKYKEMVGQRQKNATKITTLEAENRQIDNTIKTLEKEEEIRGMAYNADGSEKSAEDIASEVLSNDRNRQRIENTINNRFDSINPIKRFGARMNYYKEAEDIGGFKAFWKALTSKTKTVKRIATTSEAARTGKGMADMATAKMAKRQNDFKDTIKRETAKKMSKDSTLTANDLRDDVIKEAYKSALEEER